MMLEIGVKISMIIILLAFILAFIRLVKGPSLPDRVIALDFMAHLVMGFIIAYCVLSGRSIYIDIVLIITLAIFLGTVTISRYLKKKMYDN